MKIKVCGITRLEDAILAVDAGVWAVGFIFVENTPRYIEPEIARQIIEKLPESIEKVGVFVDSSVSEVLSISKQAGITKIQLHGDETAEYCENVSQIIRKEVIKAIHVKDSTDLEKISQYKDSVSYILLDTYSEKEKGGTGRTFDWEIAKQAKSFNIPIILAGGLTPDNITQAYEQVQPYALDLSSGVEKEKGIKDAAKLNKLKEVINDNRAEP